MRQKDRKKETKRESFELYRVTHTGVVSASLNLPTKLAACAATVSALSAAVDDDVVVVVDDVADDVDDVVVDVDDDDDDDDSVDALSIDKRCRRDSGRINGSSTGTASSWCDVACVLK